MKDLHYIQCRMRKGMCYHTAWIPASFAKLNKILKIKKDGIWEDGWKVIDTYGRLHKRYIEDHANDYQHHREATDI